MATYRLKTHRSRACGIDLARDLNPEQRAVAEAPPGYLLVLAGAGTGKTRALTYRVAHLVARGTPPERILLCTFTNRAAGEMIRRVEAWVGMDMRTCLAGTFHHVGHVLVRRYAERLGLAPDFGILDREDTATVLAGAVGALGPARLASRRFPQPRALARLLGLARGGLLPLSEAVARFAPRLVSDLPDIEAVAAAYDARKRELNVLDFDDLLLFWHRMLHDPELSDLREELQARVDHVLVDEYQDVNALQGALCDAMAARCGSLTCVGDDAQSIYSFRGADFDVILRFRDRHPTARVLALTTNYRSTPEILRLANRSIAHNRRQHPKELRPTRPSGMPPAVVPLRDVFQQAEFVAQRILEHHQEEQVPLSQMAVLYRGHSHALELQVELGRRKIPFYVRSGPRFFEQAHIKDVVAYLRARENPKDTLAWVRLLRQWPGVGMRRAERVAQAVASAQAPVSTTLEELATTLRAPAGRSLGRLAELWRMLSAPTCAPPGTAIRTVLETHYAEYARMVFPNPEVRTEDLEHLAAFAQTLESAQAFLAEVALVQGIGADAPSPGHDPDDRLVLSSIHQAKGLEWRVVFVPWLVQGRFPGRPALRDAAQIEEERRLFHVAVTRAKDALYLCFPTLEEGRDGPHRILRPSMFLKELDVPPPVFERWRIEEVPPEEDG